MYILFYLLLWEATFVCASWISNYYYVYISCVILSLSEWDKTHACCPDLFYTVLACDIMTLSIYTMYSWSYHWKARGRIIMAFYQCSTSSSIACFHRGNTPRVYQRKLINEWILRRLVELKRWYFDLSSPLTNIFFDHYLRQTLVPIVCHIFH